MEELNTLKIDLEKAYRNTNEANEELLRLKEEISGNEREKVCVNCKKIFHPRLNNNDSCVYHPGKIKFYSCV